MCWIKSFLWYSVSQPFLLWQHFRRTQPARLFHVPQGRLTPTYITEERQSTVWIQWKWVVCSSENLMKSEHVCIMIRPQGNDSARVFHARISPKKNCQLSCHRFKFKPIKLFTFLSPILCYCHRGTSSPCFTLTYMFSEHGATRLCCLLYGLASWTWH